MNKTHNYILLSIKNNKKIINSEGNSCLNQAQNIQ
jgi:hypothetical protein